MKLRNLLKGIIAEADTPADKFTNNAGGPPAPKKKEEEPVSGATDNGESNSGESDAAKQAHKLGLTSKGYGNWADQSGETVAKTVKGQLVKVEKGEEPEFPSEKGMTQQDWDKHRARAYDKPVNNPQPKDDGVETGRWGKDALSTKLSSMIPPEAKAASEPEMSPDEIRPQGGASTANFQAFEKLMTKFGGAESTLDAVTTAVKKLMTSDAPDALKKAKAIRERLHLSLGEESANSEFEMSELLQNNQELAKAVNIPFFANATANLRQRIEAETGYEFNDEAEVSDAISLRSHARMVDFCNRVKERAATIQFAELVDMDDEALDLIADMSSDVSKYVEKKKDWEPDYDAMLKDRRGY